MKDSSLLFQLYIPFHLWFKKIAFFKRQKSCMATKKVVWQPNFISFFVVVILWSLHGCCMNICFGDSLVCNKLCGGIYQQRTATTTAATKTTNWVPHIAKVHPFGTNIPYHTYEFGVRSSIWYVRLVGWVNRAVLPDYIRYK